MGRYDNYVSPVDNKKVIYISKRITKQDREDFLRKYGRPIPEAGADIKGYYNLREYISYKRKLNKKYNFVNTLYFLRFRPLKSMTLVISNRDVEETAKYINTLLNPYGAAPDWKLHVHVIEEDNQYTFRVRADLTAYDQMFMVNFIERRSKVTRLEEAKAKETENAKDIADLIKLYGFKSDFTLESLNNPEVQQYLRIYTTALGFNYATTEAPTGRFEDLHREFIPDEFDSKEYTAKDIRIRTQSYQLKEFDLRANIVDAFTTLSFIKWSYKIGASPLDFIDEQYVAVKKDDEIIGFKSKDSYIGNTPIMDVCEYTESTPSSKWVDGNKHQDDLDERIAEETKPCTVYKLV